MLMLLVPIYFWRVRFDTNPGTTSGRGWNRWRNTKILPGLSPLVTLSPEVSSAKMAFCERVLGCVAPTVDLLC